MAAGVFHEALDGGRALTGLDVGQGRPVVLLHGALTTHVDWLDAPLAAFAKRGRVLAVDRPGHGGSQRARFAATPREQARQIREALRRRGVERPLLVGHSFGGMVALAWAEQFPKDAAGLLLLSPITHGELRPLEHAALAPRGLPLVGPVLAEWGRWTLDGALIALAQRAMFHPEAPPADWLRRYPYASVRRPEATVSEGEDAAAIGPGAPAAMPDLGRITAPIAIVAGAQDLVVDHHRHAGALARRLPGARLTVLEGVGHMPHHQALGVVLDSFDDLAAHVGTERVGSS